MTTSAFVSTVFVSGATGFIAQHLIKLLLSEGYKVIGSVRSPLKGEHLKKLFKDGFDYTVVPELVQEGAFNQSLKEHPDISVFYHTASPVLFTADDPEKNIINPTIEGTKNALDAVVNHGKNVKAFVLTSSFLAVSSRHKIKPKAHITENTWTNVTLEEAKGNSFVAYVAAKTFGEKYAWDFVQKEKPNFTFSTINPVYVFGPQAFDSEVKENLNLSAEFVNQFLKLKPNDPLPDLEGYWCDVRDVAKAHLIAGTWDSAADKRLLLANGYFSAQVLVDVLHKNFPELNDRIPKGIPGTSSIDPTGRNIDTSKTREILGFEPFSFEQSIIDSAKQSLDSRI